FGLECFDPCAQAFDLRVCAAEPGGLRTTVGLTIEAEAGQEALAEAQTVMVPSWRDPHERPPHALLDALIAARARGAHL
ncbi:GlxA family transcriptional regulator, partial [Pseudomonas aeruginosa]